MAVPLIEKAGYEIELDDQRPEINFTFPQVDEDFLADKVWPFGHIMAGMPIMLRDYQVSAINDYLKNFQSIQKIATGAGKSIICACLSKLIEPYGRSIIIVPSKDLVRQTEVQQ